MIHMVGKNDPPSRGGGMILYVKYTLYSPVFLYLSALQILPVLSFPAWQNPRVGIDTFDKSLL